ncbi:hypothetical protein BGI41_05035 [Methanobrevibacter sp. 87.7]|uniref:hypothetical protein n=1 Tax=Methanobrevibacter sp. 87.7 TaxID=387957 RepID=UPI000B5082CE|nr:hypothetical protein [Methanobrevibacter sp. 87.7]OWT32926.1 hypothetical protein BGI41_05035 [Methanobrevibacter sp. 87.7]
MFFIKKRNLYRIFVICLILFTGLGLISATDNNTSQIQLSTNENLTDSDNSDNVSVDDNSSNLNTDSEVYTANGGIRNISFSNGYNGYCVNLSLHSAGPGQKFNVTNTSVIYNPIQKVATGDYLKILFYNYWDSVNTYNMSVIQDVIWRFSDSPFIPYTDDDYDGPIVSSLVRNIINDYNSGVRIDDHGAIKKLDNNTELIFDFETFVPFENTVQSYFGYKVTSKDMDTFINNTTINTTNNTTNITNDTNANGTFNFANGTGNIVSGNGSSGVVVDNGSGGNNVTNGSGVVVDNGTGSDNITNDSSNNFTGDNSTINNGTNNTIINNKINIVFDNNSNVNNSTNGSNLNNGTDLGSMYNTGNPLFLIIAALAIIGLIPFNSKK